MRMKRMRMFFPRIFFNVFFLDEKKKTLTRKRLSRVKNKRHKLKNKRQQACKEKADTSTCKDAKEQRNVHSNL